MTLKSIAIITLAAFATISMSSCKRDRHTVKATNATAAYTNFQTTLMGSEGDGTLTVRAWGQGSSKGDAIEQAKKKAVETVLFKGFTGNTSIRPLVTEVNARERYEKYFDPFFKDGGEYRKFVKEESAGEASRIEAKGSAQTNYGVICTVDRPKLRKQLVKDGVLAE